MTSESAAARADPAICVCLATYRPDRGLLGIQIGSLKAQSETDWVCMISDDCSSPEEIAVIEELIAGDERFVLHRGERRLGSYRNFERCLRFVPPGVEYVAFCDQDDRWNPDKLARLRDALNGGAQLAYSDARVVSAEGVVLSDTYWTTRSNNWTDLAQLVVANTVTGAASLFCRSLLDVALPFPEQEEGGDHDHWIALIALCLGGIAYVDAPLYDYVQHGGAVLGHETANRPNPEPAGRAKVAGLLAVLKPGDWAESLTERRRRWELDLPYLRDTARLAQELERRVGGRISLRDRLRLRPLVALDRPLRGLPWLTWRTLRSREDGPTLARERQLLRGKLALRAGATAGRRGQAGGPQPRD